MKVKMDREEFDSIVSVADRMAKRMGARFVVDHERVEVIEPQKDLEARRLDPMKWIPNYNYLFVCENAAAKRWRRWHRARKYGRYTPIWQGRAP